MKNIELRSNKKVRVILSGGGTAGHIYPAIAVAERLQQYYGDDIDILFVGAKGKMEMTRVAEHGYNIIGLPIAGLQRRLTFSNLLLPFKVIRSVMKARAIVSKFKPQVVMGFGGYASAPILKAAQYKSVATMIWEGNSYAGMANKVLGKSVQKVFVAYDNMERFFDESKIVISGNPLRCDFKNLEFKSQEAKDYFNFDKDRPTVLITGGSLGTRVFNEAVMKFIDKIVEKREYNVIWQTGGFYYKEMVDRLGDRVMPNVWVAPFIEQMSLAYSLADVAVGRAGASTLSELALVGMPSIIIPSANVADDHQRKNALALVESGSVVMIEDNDAVDQLIPKIEELLTDNLQLNKLRLNISDFAKHDPADIIINEISKFIII